MCVVKFMSTSHMILMFDDYIASIVYHDLSHQKKSFNLPLTLKKALKHLKKQCTLF